MRRDGLRPERRPRAVGDRARRAALSQRQRGRAHPRRHGDSRPGPRAASTRSPTPPPTTARVAPAQVTDCFGATGDCYRAAVSAPSGRPSPPLGRDRSWRRPSGGDPSAQWPLHVGETFADVPRTNRLLPVRRDPRPQQRHRGLLGHGLLPAARAPRASRWRCSCWSAREGLRYAPPACDPPLPRFTDVPARSPFCRWIEELARRGVVAGCGANLLLPRHQRSPRPDGGVRPRHPRAPRLHAAAVRRGLGAVFADVPASSPFCRWVEELTRRGVVARVRQRQLLSGGGRSRAAK